MPRSGVRSEAMSAARRKEWEGPRRQQERPRNNGRKLNVDMTVRDPATRRMTGQGREVWHMHVIEGYSQQEVAEAFGITQGRVSQICNAIRESIPQPVLEEFHRDELSQLRALQQPFVAMVRDENKSDSIRMKANREVMRNKQTQYDLLGVKTLNIRAIVSNRDIQTFEFLENGIALPDDDPRVVEWKRKLEEARMSATPLAIEG